MKKLLILSALFFTLTAALFTGCNFNSKNKSPATVTVSVATEFENMRSAVPGLSYTDCTWEVTASNGKGISLPSTSSEGDNKVFVFENVPGGKWEFTAVGYVEDSSNNAKNQVFSGSKKIDVIQGRKYSEIIQTYYVKDKGNGKILLSVDVINGLTIEAYFNNESDQVSFKSPVGNSTTKVFARANVAPGDYDFVIKVFDGDVYLCTIKQKLCVRSNVTTNKWAYSGEIYLEPTEDGYANLVISKENINKFIDTQIYVTGTGGTLTKVAPTEEDGSWRKPFTTIDKAFDKVKSIRQNDVKYTIWIDGTVVKTTNIPMGLSINANQQILLDVCGLNSNREDDIIDGSVNPFMVFGDDEDNDTSNSLRFMDLTIQNCNSSGFGGILNICDVHGEVDFINCNLKNNKAESSSGGAININAENCKLVLDGCTFENNRSDVEGGAISITAGNAEINDCTFSGNSGRFGGAIFLNSGTTMTISDSTFTANYCSSNGLGGAIYSTGKDNLTLKNVVTIKNNYREISRTDHEPTNLYLKDFQYDDGNHYSRVLLDSTFASTSRIGITLDDEAGLNPFTVGYSSTEAAKDGTLPSSIFSSDGGYEVKTNSSNEVYLYNLDSLPFGTENISFKVSKNTLNVTTSSTEADRTIAVTPRLDSVNFTEAQYEKLLRFNAEIYFGSEKIGSTIDLLSSDNKIVLDNTRSWTVGNYDIKLSIIYDNKKYSDTKGYIYIGPYVSSDSISGIQTVLNGDSGIVKLDFGSNNYSVNSSDLQSLNISSFPNGTKFRVGYDSYSDSNLKSLFIITHGNFEIDGSDLNIISNSSFDRIFAISGEDTVVTIKNLNLKYDGSSDTYYFIKGKAILIDKGARVILVNCTIENFQNACDGIVQVCNGASLTIENCNFSKNIFNSTVCNSGAVRVDTGASCVIKNSRITENEGQHMGAGIYNEGILEISNCEIASNTAQRGAGIYSEGEITIKDTTIKSNLANLTGYYACAGGGVWIANSSNNYFEGCIFELNKVGPSEGQESDGCPGKEHSGGGGIYIEKSSLKIKNCTFTSNSTGKNKNGGAIQIYAPSGSAIPSLTFEGTITASGNNTNGTGQFLYISSEVGAKINGTQYSKGKYSDSYPLNMR